MRASLLGLLLIPLVAVAHIEEAVREHLTPTDWVFPYYRDKELARSCLSVPRSVVVGAQYLLAAGLAHGLQLLGSQEVVYVSGGDGSTAQGDFYEALNYAALHRLPLIFVIYDDGMAYGVATPRPYCSIEALGSGRPNLATCRVDNRDREACSAAVGQAVKRARSGEGPSLIVARLPSPDPAPLLHGAPNSELGRVVRMGQHVTDSPSRQCFNTPLAESTIVGVALGMSLDGFHRPVAEIQDGEFVYLAMHQIREMARLAEHCPVVLQLSYGLGPNPAGALLQFSGIKIALLSQRADAEALLKEAVLEKGPVIILEHRSLSERIYNGVLTSLGKAAVVREGSDVTVVTWGPTVATALEMADTCTKSVEVVDLRTAVPLDLETILESVKKTGHLMVVGDCPQLEAEVVAQVVEQGFEFLLSPPRRLSPGQLRY